MFWNIWTSNNDQVGSLTKEVEIWKRPNSLIGIFLQNHSAAKVKIVARNDIEDLYCIQPGDLITHVNGKSCYGDAHRISKMIVKSHPSVRLRLKRSELSYPLFEQDDYVQ